jgi:long-chain acyl-CoA synthetase
MGTEVDIENRPASIPVMFFERVRSSAGREAYRFPVGESWQSLTWAQTEERVRKIAAGLIALGVSPEDRVAIASGTRIEWILADFGINCAGAATTTVYPTTTADDTVYILSDSGSRVLFAEDDEQVAKVREHRGSLPDLVKVITFSRTAPADAEPQSGDTDGDWVMSLAELEQLGQRLLESDPDALDRVMKGITPDHLATLIYTSGTTGRPKGVRLTHGCWTYEAVAQESFGLVTEEDVQYLWLPLSHSFGKVMTLGQLRIGYATAVDGRIPKLVENLPVVRPTFMAAAPRIFEKVHNRVIATAKDEGGLKYRIFTWALGVGKRTAALRREGKPVPAPLAFQHRIADKLVFSKMRNRFGGRVRAFISGSAPLSADIAEFFDAAGLPILEGYGLTETSAGSLVNPPEDYRFGTVGKPFHGTEVKIAEDGEVLLRGPGVMRGYHNLPEQTGESFTADGWFRTGDIGVLDADGYLSITDRKKDLMKTSGGKYIAPTVAEGHFKAVCPYVGQILVHGHARNFCTALISLDEEAIMGWAAGNELAGHPYAEVVAHPMTRELVAGYVEQLNARLNPWETIKRFEILPRDLTVESGELTPSLKLKRRVVEDRYGDLLDKMYQGAVAEV